MTEDLREPTFGPITADPKSSAIVPDTGRKGGAAASASDGSSEDVSASEEENESRIPGDPRDINEQQPPTSLEF